MMHFISSLRASRFLMIAAGMTVFASVASAQSAGPARHNGMYIELLGNGGLYSINYEREVADGLRARIGIASWTSEYLFGGGASDILTVPVTLHVIRGRGNHRLDAGGGILAGRRTRRSDFGSSESDPILSLVGTLGYRYEPLGRRLLFRAAFTPFFGFGDDEAAAYPDKGFLPSAGVSVGFAF
jgi:hypothetical protein